MTKKIKKNKILGKLAIRLAQNRAKNDPEFLADITRAFLRRYFREITAENLHEAYNEGKDLTEYISPNMDKFAKYAKKINLNPKEIKGLIDQHMPSFEISWIYQWWKKDHKHLYAVLMNQPSKKKEEMEIWIVEQTELVMEKLTSKL